MRPNHRKFVIAVVVLGALVLVFLGYLRFGGDEPIDLSTRERFGAPIPISTMNLPDDAEPMAGATTPGTVRQTVFRHKNDKDQVDREFGFGELLRQEGNQYEITKPWMRLYTPRFRCDITANRGQVRCETSLGNEIMAEDAMFSGNVVVHIVPYEPNDPTEMYIYLDDVTFLADQSLFTTVGPIKFVSRVGQLVGRGMDLIYDAGRNRLELFRIADVESLRLSSAVLEELIGPLDMSADTETPPEQSGTADDATASDVAAAPAPEERSPADLYECIFWDNVRIETPEQIVVALRHLAVREIDVSNGGSGGSNEPVPATQPGDANAPESVPYPGPNALDTSPSTAIALDTLPESSFDIVVTCEGGFVVGPEGVGDDSTQVRADVAAADDEERVLPELTPDPNYMTLCAMQIDVDATTSNADLAGPVRITATLDPNEVTGREGEPMPVTVTAQQAVRYLAATNQISFEGDCVATIRETVEAPDAEPERRDYTLRTPAMLLDLDTSGRTPAMLLDLDTSGRTPRVNHATTSGDMVSVYVERLIGGEPVGFVRLDGTQLDCGLAEQAFIVTGPGQISLYNGQADTSQRDADPAAFSLRQPCYALVGNFSRLTYLGLDQRIVAESDERIQIGYIPILANGSYGPQTNADAGHLEIELTQTPSGQLDLATLAASRGVTYADESQDLAGSTLTYDHATTLLHVTGDTAQPCLFNGVPVDEIEMDVSTRDAKGHIRDSGAIQVR